jgi:YidC/Oxa1 family membrane protein insertase
MIHFLGAIPGLGPISQFFANVLKFFNGWTGNFALDVILLTVAFRIVVLPLSIKQTKSMIAMQKLQPQLKEIQKKYKDDREKQGQEMMALYKENKVSPLGGCLPLLIQLPILFALFEVLHNTAKYVHFKTDYSFLGIQNVVATGSTMWRGGWITFYNGVRVVQKPMPAAHYPGHEYWQVIVLILLTIGTGYVSAKMMTTDPRQSKMMALMPVIFGVFAWILPAGVTIYIIVTNILTMLQQWIQLEQQGFYRERREERVKSGEPTGFFANLRANTDEHTHKALVALHIRRAHRRAKTARSRGRSPPQRPPQANLRLKNRVRPTRSSLPKKARSRQQRKVLPRSQRRKGSTGSTGKTGKTGQSQKKAPLKRQKRLPRARPPGRNPRPGRMVRRVTPPRRRARERNKR